MINCSKPTKILPKKSTIPPMPRFTISYPGAITQLPLLVVRRELVQHADCASAWTVG